MTNLLVLASICKNRVFTCSDFYIALLTLSRRMDEQQIAELEEVFLFFLKNMADGVLNTTATERESLRALTF